MALWILIFQLGLYKAVMSLGVKNQLQYLKVSNYWIIYYFQDLFCSVLAYLRRYIVCGGQRFFQGYLKGQPAQVEKKRIFCNALGKWIKIAQVEFSSIPGRVSLSIIFLLSLLFYSFLEMCKSKASLWIFSPWSAWLKWKLRTTQATPHLTKHMYLYIFPVVLCPSQERLSPCRSIWK